MVLIITIQTWRDQNQPKTYPKKGTWKLSKCPHPHPCQVDMISENNLMVQHVIGYSFRFQVHNAGDFLLRSPRKMTGTDGFLNQKSEVSGCQREQQESCLDRKFAEKGFKDCKCRPWGLASLLPNKVRDIFFGDTIFSFSEHQILSAIWE